MAFSQANRKGTMNGIIFVAIFAAAATMISGLTPVMALGISPLVIGIVMGMVMGMMSRVVRVFLLVIYIIRNFIRVLLYMILEWTMFFLIMPGKFIVY
jgi:uncharacterized membrane protein YadS